jgi:hypothetical protein
MTLPTENNVEEDKYRVVVLVGLEEGFIKVIELLESKDKPRA